MILNVHTAYIRKQHKPADLRNGEELRFICGTDGGFIVSFPMSFGELLAVNFASLEFFATFELQTSSVPKPGVDFVTS